MTEELAVADPVRELGDVVDSIVEVVLLVQGRTAQGRLFWAYVSMPPGRLQAFRAAEAAGDYRLDEWGAILRSGAGREPPVSIKAEMASQHGVFDDFESRVAALALL